MKLYTTTFNADNNANIDNYGFYYNTNNDYAKILKNKIANNLAEKYAWFEKPASYKSAKSVNYPKLYDFDKDYETIFKVIKYKTHFTNKDEYDFEIDGTPVRIYDNMIQIGNRMFSTNASSDYYYNLTPVIKNILIKITIKINNYNY